MSVREHDVSGDDGAVFALTLGKLRDESQGNPEMGLILKPGSRPFLAVYAGDLVVMTSILAVLDNVGMIDAQKVLAMLDEPSVVRA